MIRRFRTIALRTIALRNIVLISLVALQIPFSVAQSKPQPAPAAPVPPPILAARRVFIANAGGDEMASNEPVFSGTPNRAYDEFYRAVKNWGHFEIVASPAEADLLLEVRESVSGGWNGRVGSGFNPQFRLKIRDAKTNALLWGLSINSEFGLGQAESDRNFDQAINRLTAELRILVTPPPAHGNGP